VPISHRRGDGVAHHAAPLLEPTLDALKVGDDRMTVHLGRGYNSRRTRTLLAAEMAV
jgi:hypothetical protein